MGDQPDQFNLLRLTPAVLSLKSTKSYSLNHEQRFSLWLKIICLNFCLLVAAMFLLLPIYAYLIGESLDNWSISEHIVLPKQQ